eukprot:TRINITY_DN2957_c0_g1_i1.p1 TRINITY_DN2957_c0_g1~~TRINITY_DN2957_c0_g1_i1.p1  ORF type:complete len:814 (-),score=84.93 TRINITY_DN2957_c0_g1_i1:237-2678(-)
MLSSFIICSLILSYLQCVYSVVDTEKSHLLGSLRQFEIVAIEDNSQNSSNRKRLQSDAVPSIFANHAKIRFGAFSRTFELDLVKKTELFSPNYYEERQTFDDQHRLVRTTRVLDGGYPIEKNCYYQGTVSTSDQKASNSRPKLQQNSNAGSRKSDWAAVDRCQGGFSGMIFTGGEFYMISPAHLHMSLAEYRAKAAALNSVNLHVVYRTADLPQQKWECGVGSETPSIASILESIRPDHLHPQTSSSSSSSLHSAPPRPSVTKVAPSASSAQYVEYFVANDHRRYEQLLDQTEANTASIVNLVDGLYVSGGFSPPIRVQLVAQVTFVNEDPYTVTEATWCTTAEGCSPMEVNVDELLPLWHSWRTSALLPYHDNGALYSGYDFIKVTLGYAAVGSMCYAPRDSGSIDQIWKSQDPSMSAAVAAHEMGHNLYMRHDGSGNTCPTSGYIMNAVLATIPTEWSTCSHDYYYEWLDYGASCLNNVPTKSWAPHCGNGLLEDNETCDCGSVSECQDHCCNATACQYKLDAQCAANDGCCNTTTCRIINAETKHVCRASSGSCDMEEICTGDKACPSDLLKGAGAACETKEYGSGACYEGSCMSLNRACGEAGKFVSGGPWYAAENHASCNEAHGKGPCATMYCSSAEYTGCMQFSAGGIVKTVPNGVPCGSWMQCLNNECVPSEQVNAHYRWVGNNWLNCDTCGTVQSRTQNCLNVKTAEESSSTVACSQSTVTVERQCINVTLGCVYRGDVSNNDIRVFGQTVAKNTLLFSVLGTVALFFITIACCYQAVTFGPKDELDEEDNNNEEVPDDNQNEPE